MADIKDVINTLDEAIDGFEKVVGASQAEMYKELLVLMKDLETSNGHVKQTIHNLKLLTAIKSKLGKIANNDKYISGVEKLIGYFDKLQGQQNDYFSRNFAEKTLGMEAKKKHDLMKQIAVQNTINALTDDGLKAGVTDKINDILLRAVTTGAKFGDLQEELRAHMLGKDGGQGALARYANTYATTSISQFTGQNNKLLTQDLGMEWFMYVGSNIETTREFCQHLTKKRYIHISEIPTILSGKIDDHQCAIYAKTNLPYGMIEGTNEENFQVNCGGWNCRHQLVPVHELAVPADIRAKFEDFKDADNGLILKKEKYQGEDPNNIRAELIQSKEVRKMFKNGEFKKFYVKDNPKANAGTDAVGNIYMSSSKMTSLMSAFEKIKNGEIKIASDDELSAMYSLWHEMWHNNHKINENDKKYDDMSTERKVIEMANELVARNTIDVFYDGLGIKQSDMPRRLKRRLDCGYDSSVVSLERYLDFVGVSKEIVVTKISKFLTEGVFDDIIDKIADILMDSGFDEFEFIKNGGYLSFTRTDAKRIVNVCLRTQPEHIIRVLSAEYKLLRKKEN